MTPGPFSTAPDDDQHALMGEINMTPFVDIMLVLLIIFIVTLPVIHHKLAVELPQATSQPDRASTSDIALTLRADGTVLWDQRLVVDAAALRARLTQAALASAQPDLRPGVRLYADRATRYQDIASVMSAAQTAGLSRISFVTAPNPISEQK
jgi:biopolymer transport protein ExbD